MVMNDKTALQELDDEIIGRTLIGVFKYRIEHPTASMKDTCKALNLNYHTTLTWIKKKRLNTYIAQLHDTNSDIAQATALNHLPDIVESMARVALGEKTMRGQNPQAAADFILRVAQSGARLESGDAKDRILVQTNVYMPKMNKSGSEPLAHSQIIDV